jgi:hypothetical protein
MGTQNRQKAALLSMKDLAKILHETEQRFARVDCRKARDEEPPKGQPADQEIQNTAGKGLVQRVEEMETRIDNHRLTLAASGALNVNR